MIFAQTYLVFTALLSLAAASYSSSIGETIGASMTTGVTVFIASILFGLFVFWIFSRLYFVSENRLVQIQKVAVAKAELLHPNSRITLLSSGKYLVTDIPSGKAIGEYPLADLANH